MVPRDGSRLAQHCSSGRQAAAAADGVVCRWVCSTIPTAVHFIVRLRLHLHASVPQFILLLKAPTHPAVASFRCSTVRAVCAPVPLLDYIQTNTQIRARWPALLCSVFTRPTFLPCCIAYYAAGSDDMVVQMFGGEEKIDAMISKVCVEHPTIHFLPGAGHWVQQEKPAAVNALLLKFLEQGARRCASTRSSL